MELAVVEDLQVSLSGLLRDTLVFDLSEAIGQDFRLTNEGSLSIHG